MCAPSLSHVQFFATPWTLPARLLCLWDFSDKNTGVGCHFLLQGIVPSQGLNLHLQWLLHWHIDFLKIIYLSCAGSSLLCGLFPSCRRQGSHCGCLSCCGAQTQQLRCAGFVAHLPRPGIKPVSPALAQSGTEMYLLQWSINMKKSYFQAQSEYRMCNRCWCFYVSLSSCGLWYHYSLHSVGYTFNSCWQVKRNLVLLTDKCSQLFSFSPLPNHCHQKWLLQNKKCVIQQ